MATTTGTSTTGVDRLLTMYESGTHPEYAHVTLLGLATYDAVKLHERVERGLSFHALDKLRRVLDVPTSEFAELIWVAPRTLARRKEAKRLQPDESDRLLRMSRVVGTALRLFEGRLPEARAWLLGPHEALGGEVPIRLAASEIGAREVENLIGRLEHGIPL